MVKPAIRSDAEERALVAGEPADDRHPSRDARARVAHRAGPRPVRRVEALTSGQGGVRASRRSQAWPQPLAGRGGAAMGLDPGRVWAEAEVSETHATDRDGEWLRVNGVIESFGRH